MIETKLDWKDFANRLTEHFFHETKFFLKQNLLSFHDDANEWKKFIRAILITAIELKRQITIWNENVDSNDENEIRLKRFRESFHRTSCSWNEIFFATKSIEFSRWHRRMNLIRSCDFDHSDWIKKTNYYLKQICRYYIIRIRQCHKFRDNDDRNEIRKSWKSKKFAQCFVLKHSTK